VRPDGVAVLEGEVAAIHGRYLPLLTFDTRGGAAESASLPIQAAVEAVHGSPVRLVVDPRTGRCLDAAGPPARFGPEAVAGLPVGVRGSILQTLNGYTATAIRRYFDAAAHAHPGGAGAGDTWRFDDQEVYSYWAMAFRWDLRVSRHGDLVHAEVRPGSAALVGGLPGAEVDVRSGERTLRIVDGALEEARMEVVYALGGKGRADTVEVALVRLDE